MTDVIFPSWVEGAFGTSISHIQDLNNDGIDDILVGSIKEGEAGTSPTTSIRFLKVHFRSNLLYYD